MTDLLPRLIECVPVPYVQLIITYWAKLSSSMLLRKNQGRAVFMFTSPERLIRPLILEVRAWVTKTPDL